MASPDRFDARRRQPSIVVTVCVSTSSFGTAQTRLNFSIVSTSHSILFYTTCHRHLLHDSDVPDNRRPADYNSGHLITSSASHLRSSWTLPRGFVVYLYSVAAAYTKLDDGSLISLRRSVSHFIFPFFLSPSLDSMTRSSSLPQWHSFTKSSPTRGCISCRQNGFFHSFNSIPGMGILFGSSFLVGFVFYMAFLSPHGPLLLRSSESYRIVQLESNKSTPTNHTPSSHASHWHEAPSLLSDVLSLEQVRDIVATTRGFLSRDYSLNLGWNNVSIRCNLVQAELMIPK
jgi:hypothetical protein